MLYPFLLFQIPAMAAPGIFPCLYDSAGFFILAVAENENKLALIMNLQNLSVDHTWTLFLDRDGVINKKRENDYVKKWEELHFLPGALTALNMLALRFERIIVVTNQQGIAKGLYTAKDLGNIHARMLDKINEAGGRIDKIYFCPALAKENADCRKPNTGMAFEAKKDFPEIDFNRSIIVGDTVSDMEFGRRLGMVTAFISKDGLCHAAKDTCDFVFPDLISFTKALI